jgi:predicted nucleotidyltransferase
VIGLAELRSFFADRPYVKLAILFGSRASGRAEPQSDYDFAVAFAPTFADPWGGVAVLRSECNALLKLADEDFDVVDLSRADAAVLSGIRAGHVVLKGDADEIRRLLGEDQAQC